MHISQTSSFWVKVACLHYWSNTVEFNNNFFCKHILQLHVLPLNALVTHKFNKWCLYPMKTTKVYNNTSIKEVNTGQWRHFHKLFLPPPLPLGVAGVGLEWGVGPIWFVVTEVAANKSHCCVYHSKICHMLYVRLHQETNLKLYITIWVIALTT